MCGITGIISRVIAMNIKEIPLLFRCQGEQLPAILHQGDGAARLGVLLVVGGPQYRVGSHRQFVLLARYLAGQGIPVMRFDVRGMGDAEGQVRKFSELDDDIAAAVDCFLTSSPQLQGVVIWGLCDAASAALFYAYQDQRIKGLVLLNPWVFTEQGAAKTYLKHYYWQRLTSLDFWHKVLSLRFNYAESITSLLSLLRRASRKSAGTASVNHAPAKVHEQLPLPTRMRECWKRFSHPVLLILSGHDLTADEFREALKAEIEWQRLLAEPRVTRYDFAEADHTFSAAAWRNQVAVWTSNWISNL
jgi:exosortase A-associated hydrolase 1